MQRRSFIAGLLTLPFAGSAVKATAAPLAYAGCYNKLQMFGVSVVKTPTDPACVIEKSTEEYLRELQEKGIPVPNSMYLNACGFPGL